MPAICGRIVLLMAWMLRMPRLLSSDLLGGVDAVTLPAVREAADAVDAPLYMSAQRDASDERTSLKLVPYYAWANRELGQMNVWLRS